MKISEIMNRAFVVESNITLKKAAKIFSQKNIGSLIIMKNKKVAGILTERDIIKNISFLNKKVSSIMAKKIIAISPDESIERAAEIMSVEKIKRLPVMENGKLVGIITATDVLANSDLLNEDLSFL